ncbi:hypothetical protein [Nonomuraea jiangxiensis]|nr:hypothetical protein [Nonomuraea jiangxiensis]
MDVEQMRQVLEHHAIGAFPSVDADTERTADEMRARIAQYLESLSEDDLALLYIRPELLPKRWLRSRLADA